MIWKPCELIQMKETGKDALDNPIAEPLVVLKTHCRSTPWTDTQLTLEDRNVTENQQQFVIPVIFKDFPESVTHARIDKGTVQKIVEVSEQAPRYTVLRVEVYKR